MSYNEKFESLPNCLHASPGEGHRLLNPDEATKSGDEILWSAGWEKMNAAFVGSTVWPNGRPMRRKLDSVLECGAPTPRKSCVMLGPGGAPCRASILPEGAAERKKFPVASGVLDYFPDAIAALAEVSWQGNEQHNKGQSLRWDRSKSGDEADTLQRHFLQRGTRDKDGLRHTAKMAWRALALLQKEIEAER